MTRARCRLAAAFVLGASFWLAAPATAPAAVTCHYSSQVLQVDLGAVGDTAKLNIATDGEISVGNLTTQITCTGTGPPTTTNTNAVNVINHPGASNNVVVIYNAAYFGPGATPEPGDDEIEIFVFLNDAPGSALAVMTPADGGTTRFGTSGINPNALSDEDTPDADIFPTDVPLIMGYGRDGDDVLDAQGGAGTGNPLTVGLDLIDLGGANSLTGGQGDDRIFGNEGNDLLRGMGGNDQLDPGEGGDDTLDGGGGTDTANYFGSHVAVSIDLAIAGPQNTGGGGIDSFANVEDLVGTFFPDVLRGDGGPNGLRSGDGADVLEGRGGTDVIDAGPGDDSLDVRDGGPDSAACGPGSDTVTADPVGVDTLSDCEQLVFPPPAPTPSGGGGPVLPTTGPVLARAAIRSLRLAPTAFLAAPSGPSARATARPRPRPTGTIVSFSLNLPAAVTYRVARLLAGRRAGRRCLAPTRTNRNARRCTRLVAVRGSFTRNAVTGQNRFRFTGRIAGRKLAPGSYQLQATPRANASNGITARTPFRITNDHNTLAGAPGAARAEYTGV
jgi:hemolysin type calcium-binding protein